MLLYSFIALKKADIFDFEAGNIDKHELIERLCAAPRMLLDDIFELIITTLERIAPENPAVSLVGEERNILADGNGDALLLESYIVSNQDDCGYEICEPAGYKTTNELKRAVEFLDNVPFVEFKKSLLLDDMELEFEANEELLYTLVYQELLRLKEFYKDSIKNGCYIVLISVMNDEILPIVKEAYALCGDDFIIRQESYSKWLELLNEGSFVG
jgi:hypothetical protein